MEPCGELLNEDIEDSSYSDYDEHDEYDAVLLSP